MDFEPVPVDLYYRGSQRDFYRLTVNYFWAAATFKVTDFKENRSFLFSLET